MLFFIFNSGKILLEKTPHSYGIPKDISTDIPSEAWHVITPMDDGEEVRAASTTTSDTDEEKYEWVDLRSSYAKLPLPLYLKAGKCAEILYWDKTTRFCSVCGAPMNMHTHISKVCTACGREVWPQLQTAIITLISKGDEVLLVQSKNFKRNYYGLVAGFVETGETLEEAVHREVAEEVGIRIKNLNYFGSQPWPYPCGLMVGFTAEYESGEVNIQESELKRGGWFHKDALPEIPEKLSIARMLIDKWLEDKKAL